MTAASLGRFSQMLAAQGAINVAVHELISGGKFYMYDVMALLGWYAQLLAA